jgi:hypothetical protein
VIVPKNRPGRERINLSDKTRLASALIIGRFRPLPYFAAHHREASVPLHLSVSEVQSGLSMLPEYAEIGLHAKTAGRNAE